MPRFQKKKRKGSHGKRPAEIAREAKVTTAGERRHNETLQHVASTSSIQEPQSTPKSAARLQKVENMSAKKLSNSHFKNIESNKETLTRNKSRELGLGTAKEIKVSKDYKLQDFSLLNECISKAAICQICRKSSSRLQLWQDNNKRCRLAESLFTILIRYAQTNVNYFLPKFCLN